MHVWVHDAGFGVCKTVLGQLPMLHDDPNCLGGGLVVAMEGGYLGWRERYVAGSIFGLSSGGWHLLGVA